jgi:hypothetical protein
MQGNASWGTHRYSARTLFHIFMWLRAQIEEIWVFSIGGKIVKGKTEVLRENPIPVPLCLPQILHELARDRTWASVVTVLQIMSWAMTQPVQKVSKTAVYSTGHTPSSYSHKEPIRKSSAEKLLVAALCSFQWTVLLHTVIAATAETRIHSCLTTACLLSNRISINKRESLPIHYHTDKQQAWPFLLQENVKSYVSRCLSHLIKCYFPLHNSKL